MCGRYTLHQSAAAITERFPVTRWLFAPEPRYNLAPSQRVAVVLAGGVLDGFDWGWVRPGSGDPARGSRWINARAETVADKPAFRRALAGQRCLVPADGFYEWQKIGERRWPWHFRRRDGRLFAFAGLWEEGSAGRACLLITVPPNVLLAPIHDRMPAILEPDLESRWLDLL